MRASVLGYLARVPSPNVLAERLEAATVLDKPAEKIAAVLDKTMGAGSVKPLLRGDWLGHTIHPLLTDVTIGTWTSALVLDLLRKDGANALVATGLLALPAVLATGWSDWHDEEKRSPAIRRAGLVHAATNAVGANLQVASLAARRRGERGRGFMLSAVAMGFIGAGGWLGGHLTYERGSRVEPQSP